MLGEQREGVSMADQEMFAPYRSSHGTVASASYRYPPRQYTPHGSPCPQHNMSKPSRETTDLSLYGAHDGYRSGHQEPSWKAGRYEVIVRSQICILLATVIEHMKHSQMATTSWFWTGVGMCSVRRR
jgi:hypothetical protein